MTARTVRGAAGELREQPRHEKGEDESAWPDDHGEFEGVGQDLLQEDRILRHQGNVVLQPGEGGGLYGVEVGERQSDSRQDRQQDEDGKQDQEGREQQPMCLFIQPGFHERPSSSIRSSEAIR